MKEQASADQENMSNLTSASGEEASTPPTKNQPQSCASGAQKPPSSTNSTKKKRKLPGNPDPDAEVVALSPTTLLSSNRFVCEICNKGFQRDQNLQLHRRGHNLPWKLRQRSSEARKKVYVCPEAGCVHHDPSRALGDLTGIKKHFCRKHGEKRWKCDKCAKKYAVQSDWKAHAKTCGTREYRCDCGTLFSRRDSFITHRAFCDALAEESARALAAVSSNPLASRRAFLSARASAAAAHDPALKFPAAGGGGGGIAVNSCPERHDLAPNRERETPPPPQQQGRWAAGLDARPETPPWFACLHPAGPPAPPPTSSSSTTTPTTTAALTHHLDQLMPSLFPTRPENEGISPFPAAAGPHLSATALLQKAAQIGSTMSGAADLAPMAAASHSAAAARFRLGLYTHQQLMGSFGSAPAAVAQSMATAYDDSSFQEVNSGDGVAAGGADEPNTRDLLAGLRAISQREMDILSMAGLEPCMNSISYDHPQQSNKPWN